MISVFFKSFFHVFLFLGFFLLMDLVLESSGARHGRGVLTRPDGSSYSGQFEYGVVESSGAFYGWAHEDHD